MGVVVSGAFFGPFCAPKRERDEISPADIGEKTTPSGDIVVVVVCPIPAKRGERKRADFNLRARIERETEGGGDLWILLKKSVGGYGERNREGTSMKP